MFKRLSHRTLDALQHVISSPEFFWIVIIVTVVWFLANFTMGLLGLPVVDPPKDFFPVTVLVYSLLALWIENAMKVQQKQQQEMAQKQLDQIEALTKSLVDGQQVSINALLLLQKMAEDNEQRDAVIQDLITVVDHTVDAVEQTTDEILRLQKQGEVTK